MNNALWDYIRSHPEVLLQRDFLIELFMIPERLDVTQSCVLSSDKETITGTVISPELYVGKLCVFQDAFWVITQRTRSYQPEHKTYGETITAAPLKLDAKSYTATALLNGHTPVTLVPGDLVCIKPDTPPIKTIFGRYLLFATLVCPTFGDKYPFQNSEIKFNDFRNMITESFADKSVDAMTVKTMFVDRFCFLTYIAELTVPGITRKAMVKPKEIDKERDRLCALYAKELAAGDGTKMVLIEKRLEEMNKEWLKGDKAEHIFIDKKSAMSQKQLFLTTGLLEVFGEPGKVTFAATPLSHGWKKKDFVALVNEARQGSYFRGIETANGGEDAKYVSLVLQDTYIVEPDCGTTHGEVYELNAINYKKYVGKYHAGKNPKPATFDDLKASIGGTIELRSPQYCQAKTGYCARCMGLIFEVIGQQAISMAVKNLSSKFTSAALKKIHATEKALYHISDLNRFRAKT